MSDNRIHLDLGLDPEKLNQAVAQMIMNSVLGEQLKKEIEEGVKKAFENTGYGYNKSSVVSRIVDAQVSRIINEIWMAEYHDKMREKVRAALTDAHIDDMADQVWSGILGKLKRADQD